MKLSPGALLEHARSDEGRKQLRYAGVSIVFVPLGQILIQILAKTVFDGNPENNFTYASITAALILTLPNFFANKYWVWRDTNRDKLRTQILVFWVAAVLGVTIATLLTYVVDRWAKDAGGWTEEIAVFFAQLVGFGIVWVGRYLVLDRWLFKVTHDGAEPSDELLDELHREFPV